MGLENELGFDVSGTDIKAAEAAVESGGLCPKGVHHAVLEGVREVTANSGSKARELTFTVIAGPGKGCSAETTVWLPNEGQDADKRKKSENRVAIYAHRLGLLKTVVKDGKESLVPVEGKHGWIDLIGATCFIDVIHEDEEFTDKKGGHRKITKAKLSFEGVLKADDKRCQGVPTGKAPPPSAAPAAAAKKPDNFDDL